MSKSTATTKPDFSKIKSAKGAQARDKLLRATERVLETKNYHQMRITDVTKEAKVSTGLFYHYFPDLKSLVLEVMDEFVATFENVEEIEAGVAEGDWYGRILAHCRAVVDNYAEKPAVMRSLLELAESEPEFAALMRDSYGRQLELMAAVLPRMFPDSELKEDDWFLILNALGGVGDNLLRGYFIQKDKRLVKTKRSNQELAEIIATLFYRGLFLQNPPEEKLEFVKGISHMKILA